MSKEQDEVRKKAARAHFVLQGKKSARGAEAAKARTVTNDRNQGGTVTYSHKKNLVEADKCMVLGSSHVTRHYLLWNSLNDAVKTVSSAGVIERAQIERCGVNPSVVKWMADDLGLPRKEMHVILAVPATTVTRLENNKEALTGAGSHTTVAMLALIAQAEAMLQESTSDEAQGFNVRAWLGKWIQQPQPSLGGFAPAELLDTPSGAAAVSRTLGALASGAYQ